MTLTVPTLIHFCPSDKLVIERQPRAIRHQIFPSFLIFHCYFARLKTHETNSKILETRNIFMLHSAPCDS